MPPEEQPEGQPTVVVNAELYDVLLEIVSKQGLAILKTLTPRQQGVLIDYFVNYHKRR